MRFFEHEMDASVQERDQMERELRRAIDSDQILTVYQPLIDLKTGKVRAFEALMRWAHPELGEIAPERFLSIAEDSGQIGRLTDKILTQACRDGSHWNKNVELTFSISPLLLHDVGLPQRICRDTGRNRLPTRSP